MRPFVRLSLYGWCSLLLCAEGDASATLSAPSPIVAQVGDRAITLSDLDLAGGRVLYDAAGHLYEARVRALYQLLSTEVLQREASLRGLTEAQLIEEAVTPNDRAVSDAEVEALLASQRGSSPQGAKSRTQAQLYLGMKQQADAKREFIASLFDKHRVRVSLPAPGPAPAEEIRGAHTPVLGKSNAPVAIVAFSDYQCPYCRDLAQTLDALLERFPEDIRVIYRHYPLGEPSERWSHAALCADDQQQFARYHQALFASNLKSADPTQIATTLGLDVATFDICMTQRRHKARITADQSEGQRLNIQGTPTLFVAGQRFRGAQTLEQLTLAVEQARLQIPLAPASAAHPQ